jgi:hypothetical protein
MRTIISLLLVCSAIACTPPETLPEGVLDRERFTKVMTDIRLVEARINHELMVEHAGSINSERYYEEVFETQGITEEQFRSSFAYYSERPEEMKAIYEVVLADLSRLKDEAAR